MDLVTKKWNQKIASPKLLRKIPKTFSDKQAQSGNKPLWGKSRHIWINLSGEAIKSGVGLYTRGSEDHLETRNDTCHSANYPNRHTKEWHLVCDPSLWEQWWMHTTNVIYKQYQKQTPHISYVRHGPFGMENGTASKSKSSNKKEGVML